MTHVFHRQLISPMPCAVACDGIYLIDATGKKYLDGSGGAAVSSLGHGDPDVIAAIKQQADTLAFAHTGFFTSEPAERLADLLAKGAPCNSAMVYFVSGGSEAVEAALKMARQYHVERGDLSRKHFIARRQSYHGNTLGALSAGGNVVRRAPFEGMLLKTNHISACYAYRGRLDDESEHEYGQRAANELEIEIQRLDPKNVAAFIAETVGGATAGVIPPVRGYFKRIREICDRYGVLLILDEIMCGMGRTGTLFACEQDDVIPDIVCIAKGLGGGYQPIGATLVRSNIHEQFKDGSGFFQHGHTYMGHPIACAAALAVQSKIRDKGLLAQVKLRGEILTERLRACFKNHPYIGDIRGRGLFQGIELVADRVTKKPFDPEYRLSRCIKDNAMALGLICYPGSGTADGRNGDHVLLAPPFIITPDQLDEMVDMLARAVESSLKQKRSKDWIIQK
ncbi:MAG: aspartate aminotransferase family protein [Rhodospirillaceae bacterium TMED8]|nr:aspartate aminotransferase family protein [Magnetovibrio sp.]OUT52330.1 MAG: aspartate aminotransferase family protein [Rhodospirillaceae bacterium TMED8]|tara:strand:- start:1206 stop:2561 length:1356 start_codon:yes stop_codon:yes gene_type:complete